MVVPSPVLPPTAQRRDLIKHGMPQRPAPTELRTRPTTDQRPALCFFTLPRNDFAY